MSTNNTPNNLLPRYLNMYLPRDDRQRCPLIITDLDPDQFKVGIFLMTIMNSEKYEGDPKSYLNLL
jgi:hypothetical protein